MRDRADVRREADVKPVRARRLGRVSDGIRPILLVLDLALPLAGALHIRVKVVDAARPQVAEAVLLEITKVAGLPASAWKRPEPSADAVFRPRLDRRQRSR